MLIGSVNSWWSELVELQQALFIIAAVTTLFLIVQIALMLVGIGDDSSFDMDTDIDDIDVFNDEGLGDIANLRILSVRTVIAFLCMGSWVAYLCMIWFKWYISLPIGAVAGALAGIGVAYAIRAAMNLQSNGNINIENAIGKVGDVYLTIPSNRSGSGKINVLVQDSLIEREAVTDNESPIKTGEKVRIIDVLNQNTVVVAPLASPDNTITV